MPTLKAIKVNKRQPRITPPPPHTHTHNVLLSDEDALHLRPHTLVYVSDNQPRSQGSLIPALRVWENPTRLSDNKIEVAWKTLPEVYCKLFCLVLYWNWKHPVKNLIFFVLPWHFVPLFLFCWWNINLLKLLGWKCWKLNKHQASNWRPSRISTHR